MRSPMAVQTPKAFHSIKFLSWCKRWYIVATRN
jgi:hypothetical protein